MQTYLVGRRNSRQPCDIEIPEQESSVSRKHLELSITDDGRYYVVHLHPNNITEIWREGGWRPITQDFVGADEPLRLGAYQTTVRQLLGASPQQGNAPNPQELKEGGGGGELSWDPERGTFKRSGR